ncbi:hypothetical protein [Falsiroseomonas ponticola]|uniref:hypothetical protein n=1 Tax=Falsiroseomonas ponticola TaxID=2786951 RepID=UPI001933D6A6|nr:hypothetical protein [Roseomonas ponticola]
MTADRRHGIMRHPRLAGVIVATRRLALLAMPALASCAASPRPGVTGGIPAGEMAVPRLAALASHGSLAGEPDAALRWTAIPAGATQLRIIVHLHGFSAPGEPLRLVQGRLPGSGLVLPPTPPSIAILPRGRPVPGRPGAFDWPAMGVPGGLQAVVEEALAPFGPRLPAPTHLVLTAHSGGGSGLARILETSLRGALRVDEAHLFDALYGDHGPVLRWARARAADQRPGVPVPALAAIARPGTATEAPSRRLAAGLAQAGLGAPRFRVLLTSAPHNDIPRLFGPSLLADAAAALPATSLA